MSLKDLASSGVQLAGKHFENLVPPFFSFFCLSPFLRCSPTDLIPVTG